jgi:hypothetical protein
VHRSGNASGKCWPTFIFDFASVASLAVGRYKINVLLRSEDTQEIK